MKIALLHYSAPPVVGGVESVMAEHARWMAADSHEVLILAGRGSVFDDRVGFKHIPALDSRHPIVQEIKVHLDRGILPPSFVDFAQKIQGGLEAALGDTDIVIAHNVCSLNKNLPLTAALYHLTRSDGGPRLILWHHDLAWTTPRYRHELYDAYPWNLLSQPWPWAEQVVVSGQRREELAELYGISEEQIKVVPNGVDPARFFKLEAQTADFVSRLGLLDASPLILLPVRITPRKNIELALRILAALCWRLPKAALLVTGPVGPHNRANVEYLSGLIQLRNELGLDGKAHFLAELSDAFLPDEVIYDFYRLADVLLLPSREEGFGIPILEAALEGIPIYCTDIPTLRSLADGNAFLFSPDAEAEDVAIQMAQAMSYSPLLVLRSQVRSRYTWGQIYREQIAPLLVRKGVQSETR